MWETIGNGWGLFKTMANNGDLHLGKTIANSSSDQELLGELLGELNTMHSLACSPVTPAGMYTRAF